MKLSLKRHTESAVRAVVHAQRIAEELRKVLKGTEVEGEPPTFFLLLGNGYFTTCAGEGPVFRAFIDNRSLGDFIGKYVKSRRPDDNDYDKSKLRILPFDRAFTHCRKNAQDRKIFH